MNIPSARKRVGHQARSMASGTSDSRERRTGATPASVEVELGPDRALSLLRNQKVRAAWPHGRGADGTRSLRYGRARGMKRIMLPILLALLLTGVARAAVLCGAKSGAVRLRETCRKKEKTIDPSAL